MPIVNYIREHCAFMDYAADNGVTGAERLVWYALIHELNRRANGPYWPDGFIRISNKRMLALVPLGEDAFMAARNRLKQRGLIQYEQGRKNAKLPCYRVRFLTAAETPGEEDAESCPPKVDNCGGKPVDNFSSEEFYPENTGNTGGNVRGNTGGNVRGNTGDIYKPNDFETGIVDEDSAGERTARARVEDTLIEAYPGKFFPAEQVTRITQAMIRLGLDEVNVYNAAKCAIRHNANNATSYILAVLRDMAYEGDNWTDPFDQGGGGACP